MLPLLGAQVPSLVGELRSHMPRGEARKMGVILKTHDEVKYMLFNSD